MGPVPTTLVLHDEAFQRKSNGVGTAKTNHCRVQPCPIKGGVRDVIK